MRKILRVMRQELINTFVRPSYLFVAFGIPVLAVLILGGIKLIQGRSGSQTGADSAPPSHPELETEGFVDHAGLIDTIAEDMVEVLLPFETEAQARQALETGQISAYYVIPADYLERGEVAYVYPDDVSYLSDGQKWVIQWTLNLNLLGGDLELSDRIWNPIWEMQTRSLAPESAGAPVSGEDCSRPGTACQSNELIRMMPSMLVLVFFIAFMSSSNMLFSSIGTEKENRTLELLLLSIHPRELLLGKTLALGIAGLVQTILWLGSVTTLFNIGGSTLHLPAGFQFPTEIAAWSLVFFIGGFGLYASLMAGAGALVPKMKEAGAASYIAMSPLFLGYLFGIIAPLADVTGTGLLVFLSIFPFTSPVVMVMRLTDGGVPAWQLLVSIGLVFITAYFTLQAAAAMFHAQNLLSGQPFSVRRYVRAMARGL